MVFSAMSNESWEYVNTTPTKSVNAEKEQRLTAESTPQIEDADATTPGGGFIVSCGERNTPTAIPTEDDLCTDWLQEVPC
ncbi:hypothetical protein ACIP9X_03045 [Arthrobacter sp. NPDC093125]|uniref:hypothetical protein n=1 Tax=Arthrobacter sp. NPDC093125 TaxID=3363944 RepID=UPI0037FC3B9A